MMLRLLACVSMMLSALPAIATDEMTVYDLLSPESHQFAIRYDVSAVEPGQNVYFNIIRPGSEATDEKVIDRATGKEIPFTTTTAREVKDAGQADAEIPDETPFIKVPLPRPVPKDGEFRLRIWKTYRDPKSYFSQGERIIFERDLSIQRNVIILPEGYELVESTVPVIISTEKNRIAVSMVNDRPDELHVRIVGRQLPAAGKKQ